MYEFDAIIDRRGTNSIKWNVKDGELPMWVADMDFRAAPEILQALQARLDHGIFGYGDVTEDWYRAYQSWWQRRHGLTIEKDWLVFTTGVIPAISSSVRRLTAPGENVVIQTPVYNVFYNSILNNGRHVLENPLIYENGTYRMNLEDLERKLSDPQTTLMLLCNPHNPVGRIWERETLAAVGELCKKHHVRVLSDEIHCDITLPGKGYVPFAAASETCKALSVTAIAPTKCFNLAGLQTAAVCVPDPDLRHKIWRQLNTDEVGEPNAFAVCAAVAAFDKGEAWLDELCAYVAENRAFAAAYLAEHAPKLHVVPGEATYLTWVDISRVCPDSRAFADELRAKTGLFVTPGEIYGQTGRGFLRINLACPRSLVADGMQRLAGFAAGFETDSL